jgi:hypothetical protein
MVKMLNFASSDKLSYEKITKALLASFNINLKAEIFPLILMSSERPSEEQFHARRS